MDTQSLPMILNGAILNFEHKEIETYYSDIDPQIQITIHEEKANRLDNWQLLDEGYIYNSKTINGPCYYVYSKTNEGHKERFHVIGSTKPFGPKWLRQPIQMVDDSQFTLYHVKVKTFLQAGLHDDIDADAQLLNDIEMILNDHYD